MNLIKGLINLNLDKRKNFEEIKKLLMKVKLFLYLV